MQIIIPLHAKSKPNNSRELNLKIQLKGQIKNEKILLAEAKE